MKINFCVYLITNTVNGKQYVGSTIHPLKYRWAQHCSKGSNCRYLKASINKYGREVFTMEPIAYSLTEEALEFVEEQCIAQFNTLAPYGMNFKAGGKRAKFNDAYKDECSDRMKLRIKNMSEKERQNFDKGRLSYVENKKEIIIGVHKETFTTIEFSSIQEAQRDLRFKGGSISQSLSGSDLYSKGYIWFYKTIEDLSYYIEQAKLRLSKYHEEAKAHSKRIVVRKEHKIIDGIPHKCCARCEKFLILDNFPNASKNSRAWDKLYPYCRECKRKVQKGEPKE